MFLPCRRAIRRSSGLEVRKLGGETEIIVMLKKNLLIHGGGTQAACINIMKRREDEWDRDDPGLSLFNL